MTVRAVIERRKESEEIQLDRRKSSVDVIEHVGGGVQLVDANALSSDHHDDEATAARRPLATGKSD